jgi:hypothetical protein
VELHHAVLEEEDRRDLFRTVFALEQVNDLAAIAAMFALSDDRCRLSIEPGQGDQPVEDSASDWGGVLLTHL